MTGRVRRRSRAPPSLRDFVRWRSDISRRRSCAPPSLRDFVAGAPTSPVGGPAHLLLSGISSAGAPTSPAGGPAHLFLSRDFVRWRSGISRRRSCAPPSLRDFVRWRLDISRRRSCAPLLSEISFAGAPTSSVGGPARLLLSEISSAGAPTSPAACGGAVQTGKRKSAFK